MRTFRAIEISTAFREHLAGVEGESDEDWSAVVAPVGSANAWKYALSANFPHMPCPGLLWRFSLKPVMPRHEAEAMCMAQPPAEPLWDAPEMPAMQPFTPQRGIFIGAVCVCGLHCPDFVTTEHAMQFRTECCGSLYQRMMSEGGVQTLSLLENNATGEDVP